MKFIKNFPYLVALFVIILIFSALYFLGVLYCENLETNQCYFSRICTLVPDEDNCPPSIPCPEYYLCSPAECPDKCVFYFDISQTQ